MRPIHVAVAALNQTPLAWGRNSKNIIEAVKIASERGAEILCLPELCISGYGCEDAFQAAGVQARALSKLKSIAPKCKGLVVAFGLPLKVEDSLYNSACIVVDGKIAGFVLKQNLAGSGIHYEPRWFKPWPKGKVSKVKIGGTTYPAGDLYFDIGGIRIGCEICEDAWVKERPGAELSKRGVELILNPSASHFAFGKRDQREQVVIKGSKNLKVAYLYSNLNGLEAGRIVYDGDCIIAAGGKIIKRGERLRYADVTVTDAIIDLDKLGRAKSNPRKSREANCVYLNARIFKERPAKKASISSSPSSWERSEFLKHEEFWRVVSLGLFDLMRKSRVSGFTVSLSGGADSSAVSCLVALMIRKAVLELGLEEFHSQFSYVSKLGDCKDTDAVTKRLLTCVYQSTRNSSETTQNSAEAIAHGVTAEFLNLDISNLVRDYTELVESALNYKTSWEKNDVALQNIQARVRSPSVWLIANLKGAILLTTSNRSEAAVGYATMDGDTSGGFAPLGGIDKAFLLEWLKWLEKKGPSELGPYPFLSAVNKLAPTAELRPKQAKQTDEADLMPYVVLDIIERAAILDKLMPVEVYRRITRVFGKRYGRKDLKLWVIRFFKLWSISQWKRERYAPSFHLDDENLDPRTWCRFPILSGNFEEELRELEEQK